MPSTPYDPERKESKASSALTLAIGTIILGVPAFWLAFREAGMAIVIFCPMIGLALLASAGLCFYWLMTSDPKNDGRAIRTSAQICTGLLIVSGIAALSFLGISGSGIYK